MGSILAIIGASPTSVVPPLFTAITALSVVIRGVSAHAGHSTTSEVLETDRLDAL